MYLVCIVNLFESYLYAGLLAYNHCVGAVRKGKSLIEIQPYEKEMVCMSRYMSIILLGLGLYIDGVKMFQPHTPS